MSRPELPNLFTTATVVRANTNPDVYHRSNDGERGSKEFVMSRSALADFVACPSKWRAGFESRDTTATRWGTLMDALVLSPDTFDERFVIYPDTYEVATLKCPKCGSVSDAENCSCTSKRLPRQPFKLSKPWNNNATVCQEWKRKHAGKIFIHREKFTDEGEPDEETKAATFVNAQRAKGRIDDSAELKELVRCSQTQVMVMADYHDRATGLVIPFKVLLDLVPNVAHADFGKCLADFKTARNASEGAFKDAIHKGFYDWQAGIYRDAYVCATKEDRTDFLFAVQENVPPYQPALWSLGEDWLNDARAEVRQALQFYCYCLAKNEWPGYPVSTRIVSWGSLSREAWMLRDIQRVPEDFKPLTPLPPKPKPTHPQPRPDARPFVLHRDEVVP